MRRDKDFKLIMENRNKETLIEKMRKCSHYDHWTAISLDTMKRIGKGIFFYLHICGVD